MTLVVWDHLITLCDEVKYVWKKEKSWSESCWILLPGWDFDDRVAFWLFIVVRYPLGCQIRVVTEYLTEQVLYPPLQDLARDRCGTLSHQIRGQ